MKTHQIILVNRDNFRLEVAEQQYILAAIEQTGLKLPVGCRIGACITCAARLLQGEVDQPRAIALKPFQAQQGYVLLCIASPLSDCYLEVGIEAQRELYPNPFRHKPDFQ
ncbi:2Fe-2S iron-sulfur cluster binding domain-containing protein [Leptolyngbya sp. NK1-12]|uniref:2Fe-2S iron-sulfur cluster binding domain-containing protein n=1 Tax=Leptolyngbya sp. NK1-12 TaxID=2547451 RepID=A0AA96WKN2_9CYAN|nr:2Fe-2S iron-sulfur cluster binding domain-containing protein [Leptolyngbya sp. NK1-12]